MRVRHGSDRAAGGAVAGYGGGRPPPPPTKGSMHQKLASLRQKHASYGLHRVEVLGGLGSILIIWLTAGGLLYEGVSRLVQQLLGERVPVVNGVAFVLGAACGLLLNSSILSLFNDVAHAHGGDRHEHGHSHGHSDVTARAAVLHAVGDMVQSVGMLVTASLIALDGERWPILDPLVTVLCLSLHALWHARAAACGLPRAHRGDTAQYRRTCRARRPAKALRWYHDPMLSRVGTGAGQGDADRLRADYGGLRRYR